MLSAKRILFTLVFFCFISEATPLIADNPLFDPSITPHLDLKKKRTRRHEEQRQKTNAIYLFREAHKFDTLAIKVLAKSGFHDEAKELLGKAKLYYKSAQDSDPDNPLINIFYLAHDDFTDRVVRPGDTNAKAVLVRLYDGDDDTDDDFEVSLNDSEMSAYWQASKIDPSKATEAAEPKPDNPDERVSNNTKWGSAVTLCSLLATAGFKIAETYTENALYQYLGGAGGGSAGFILYLIGYSIFNCCMNQHDRSQSQAVFNDLIAAADEAFKDDDEDDDKGHISINIGSLRARTVASAATDDDISLAKRRSSVPTQTPHDVLNDLPPKCKKVYLERLQKHGKDDPYVKKIIELNRKRLQKASSLSRRHTVEIHDRSAYSRDSDNDDSYDDESDNDSEENSDRDLYDLDDTPVLTAKPSSKKKVRVKKKADTAPTPAATDQPEPDDD